MELQYSEMDNNIRLINLIGRFDVIGNGEIETKFPGYCAGNKVHVIVDLSKVTYLASIGIRTLLLTAKSVANRGGKMVILNPIPEVFYVLDISGIPTIIPVYPDLEAAQTGLMVS